jgi:hypothetical protein
MIVAAMAQTAGSFLAQFMGDLERGEKLVSAANFHPQ